MTRLTDKNTHMPNTAAGLEDFELKLAIYDKLSEVEDIEDALGCPIGVLFKALKQGVYEIVVIESNEQVNEGVKFVD